MKISRPVVTFGLPFGIGMGIYFVISSSIRLGIDMGIPGIFYGIILGIITGGLTGVLFGFLFGLIMNISYKDIKKKFDLYKKEFSKEHDIIYDSGANHFLGKEGVGGWLFMTPAGLFFKSHKFNIKKHETWIYFDAIKTISAFKFFKIFNKGLLIEKADGSIDKFVVDDNNLWAEKIKQNIK